MPLFPGIGGVLQTIHQDIIEHKRLGLQHRALYLAIGGSLYQAQGDVDRVLAER